MKFTSKLILGSLIVSSLIPLFTHRAAAVEAKEVFFSLTRNAFDADKLPTNTTIIKAQDIEKLGVQNAGQIVDQAASVNTQKTSGLGSLHLPKIRGFLNKQIVVYIDNRRVPRDLTGNVDLSQISAESIDRVEIVRGGGSVLYGPDAVGGIIHIFTKKAKGYTPSIQAGAQWGSYGAEIYNAAVGTKKERAEGYITVSRNKADNFQRNNAFDNTSVNGNIGYDAGAYGKAMAYFSHSQSQIGLPGGTTLQTVQWDGDVERTPRSQFQKQNDIQNSFEAEYEVNLFEKANLTTRLMNTDLQRDNLTTSTGPVTSRSRINRKSAYFQADSFFGLTGGLEYYRDEIRSPFSIVPESNGYGIFLQQTYSWRGLTAIGGVRFDNNTEWGDSTSPRLTLIQQAAPWLKLSGNIAKSFTVPTFADMTDFDGNTFQPVTRLSTASPLGPENTWNYDAGFEITPVDSFSAKVTIFRADIRDNIASTTTLDGTRFTSINVQKAFKQGVEVELTHRIGQWFWQTLNYSYLQSEGKGAGFAPDFVELSFVPNTRVNYSGVLTLPFGVDFGNSVHFVQEQYTGNNRTGQKLPDYATWDTQVGYKWKDVKFRVGVNNLLEQRYAENGNSASAFGPAILYPQPGRTYWGSIVVAFM